MTMIWVTARALFLRCTLLCALLLSGSLAQAQDFPELSGRVVDAANILSPATEAALTTKLANLETQSQRQLVIATIPDLQGYDISDYGYQLGRHWGIGDKERNDGVVLLIAPNERKMNISVGYGVEPVLTDALSGSIMRNDITPKFKDGDFDGGVTAGAVMTQATVIAGCRVSVLRGRGSACAMPAGVALITRSNPPVSGLPARTGHRCKPSRRCSSDVRRTSSPS